ncbi:MAG: hypothetical protein CMJ83_10360 [Planctomycetes bacterium]|nr:hypothetical protein [Planctomycetota bacterium]
MVTPDKKQRGIEALNQDFIRYEQVDKAQQYRLAESAGAEEYDDETVIPACDLSQWIDGDSATRAQFAKELTDALRGIGFAILVGHGVDPDRYVAAADRVSRFFETTPSDVKQRYRAERHGAINQGYFPKEETSDIHPDLVEGWVFCRRAFALDDGRGAPCRVADFWPDADQEAFFRDLCSTQFSLVQPIVHAILTGLGVDPEHLDDALESTNFALRMNYYPPVTAADAASGAGRLLGHEDVTLFTLLPAPTVEGLQVLNRRNERWIRLAAPPGSIILNTGDYMQRISNDVLPSTTHRVAQPTDPALRSTPRVSFPMNVYLPEDAMLQVLPGLGEPRYEPIRALTFHTRATAKYYGDDYPVE